MSPALKPIPFLTLLSRTHLGYPLSFSPLPFFLTPPSLFPTLPLVAGVRGVNF